MRARILAALLAAWPLACGRILGDAPGAAANADAGATDAGSVFVCTPGDPPASLWVDTTTDSQFIGLTTDGSRLYVFQNHAPLVWSIDTRGQTRVPLYGQSYAFHSSVNIGAPWPLLASAGGVFFDPAFDVNPGAVLWASAAGGPPRTVSTVGAGVFDWSGTYAFGWTVHLENNTRTGPILRTSLSDGSSEAFAPIDMSGDPVQLLVTRRYLHVVLGSSTTSLRDRRLDIGDGSVHDEVPFAVQPAFVGQQAFVSGPTTLCAGNLGALVCLDDEQSQTRTVGAASDVMWVRYVDADWAYVAASGPGATWLSRISLADGHEQVVATGATPSVVTSFGACVYAITTPRDQPATLWRLAPLP